MSRRWPGPPCGTGCSCGLRPSWRARRPTVCSRRCSPRFRYRGEARPAAAPAAAGPVTLTGRAALAALTGALVILAFRDVASLLVVNGLLLAAIAADLALAAPIRPLLLSRGGETKVLLGQSAGVTLAVANPGRRLLRADVRDAWPPSAGADPHHVRVRVPAGGQAAATTTLTPSRRGDKAAATVTVRSLGPLGLAARQA